MAGNCLYSTTACFFGPQSTEKRGWGCGIGVSPARRAGFCRAIERGANEAVGAKAEADAAATRTRKETFICCCEQAGREHNSKDGIVSSVGRGCRCEARASAANPPGWMCVGAERVEGSAATPPRPTWWPPFVRTALQAGSSPERKSNFGCGWTARRAKPGSCPPRKASRYVLSPKSLRTSRVFASWDSFQLPRPILRFPPRNPLCKAHDVDSSGWEAGIRAIHAADGGSAACCSRCRSAE